MTLHPNLCFLSRYSSVASMTLHPNLCFLSRYIA